MRFPPEDADLVICKNENGSVRGDVTAKEQSVNPIQSEEAPGRVAREQITAQPKTTLTYARQPANSKQSIYETTTMRLALLM